MSFQASTGLGHGKIIPELIKNRAKIKLTP